MIGYWKIGFMAFALIAGVCAPANADSFVVDEAAVTADFEHVMDVAIKRGKVPTGKELASQAYEAEGKTVTLPAARTRYKMDYDKTKDSIGVLCSLYKCDKCNAWHRGGVSTAWVAGAKGIVVTNLHVVTGAADKSALGIWFPDGKTYPVMEILAADVLQDIAVLRVDAEELVPLPLALSVSVADQISVISHPESRFYMYTQGVVSRFYLSSASAATLSDSQRGMRSEEDIIHNEGTVADRKEGGKRDNDSTGTGTPGNKEIRKSGAKRRQMWMNITAEYARGSSGAPVLDSVGRVVGMVSSTQSIYTEGRFRPENPKESTPGAFQMCIRNCVPLEALKSVLKIRAKNG